MWGSVGFRRTNARGKWSRHVGALLSLLSLVAASVVVQGLALTPIGGVSAAGAAANTVVSLTFDDGYASQYQTRAVLSAHGMHGTYYINSGTRPPDYGTLSWAQIHDLANDGNEIGGHTVDHADLPTLSTSAATAEVCNDRTALQAQGFTVTSFAYPYGHNNSTIWNIVKNCGYSSARDVSGIVSPEGCNGCPYAETIPPPNAYDTRTPENVNQTMALSEIEGFVTQAENHSGGWVQLVFHDICNPGGNCDQYSITPAHFSTLLDWLAARPSSTVVHTVGEVIGGTSPADGTPPVTTIACNGAACASTYYAASVQVSLSATDAGSGVSVIRYTTDNTTPTQSGAGGTTYSAPFAVSSNKTVKYRAYDAANNAEATKTQAIQVDAVAPTSSIKCNAATCSASLYGPSVQVTLSGTDTGGSGFAAVRYTTNGADPTLASTLYSAPFTLSAATNLKYRAWDNAGNVEATKSTSIAVDSTAPVSSVACNGIACSGGWYNATVQVSLSATDAGGAGVSAVRYTTNGTDPTPASTAYTTPFGVGATTTVKDRAYDNIGNAEAVKSQPIAIDGAAPVSSIACNGGACPVGWSVAAVHVALTAADSGASGVAAIRYTTDGSDPTLASPVYSAPLALTTITTLKYRAWDNAANAEATNTRVLQIDTAAPEAAVHCGTASCASTWARGPVKVSLSATDPGGSGVAALHYTTDGSNPTLASPVYTTPFVVAGSKTVNVITLDTAGNGAIKSVHVRVDLTPPTVTISSPANHAIVSGNVKFAATAKDALSGVAKVNFYVDGRLVTSDANAPFSVVWKAAKATKTTHTLTAKAVDRAGNSTSRSISVKVA